MRVYITIKKCRRLDLEDGDIVLLRLFGEEFATWRLWGEIEEEDQAEWGDFDLIDVQVAE